jgi:hypothetical protein
MTDSDPGGAKTYGSHRFEHAKLVFRMQILVNFHWFRKGYLEHFKIVLEKTFLGKFNHQLSNCKTAGLSKHDFHIMNELLTYC